MARSTKRAEKILVDALRGKRKASRRELVAAHADLLGLPVMQDGEMPGPRCFDILIRMAVDERCNGGVPALMLDIAADAGIAKSTLSGAVKELIAFGLVERVIPGRVLPRNLRVSKKGWKWLRMNAFSLDGQQPSSLEVENTETVEGREAQNDDD